MAWSQRRRGKIAKLHVQGGSSLAFYGQEAGIACVFTFGNAGNISKMTMEAAQGRKKTR
ncbi:hypothetical protein [Noviherbaspirillum galbum]|uniref:Uncharacterized protein n=1 Tax=Noviherbaspirillum galbum TaxID=2709383 RepID=A0A6B3SRX9_9BURK|nr:hypothetical protein [Noviherbaspirillum galbum]NEX62095.1 hypothetical protein [Noviherbaspirillum galbum]